MYVVVLSTLLLILGILDYKNKLDKKVVYITLGIISLLLLFRYDLGTDMFVYVGYFLQSEYTLIFKHIIVDRSPLFVGLIYLARLISNHYEMFLLFLNIFNTVLIIYTIYKNSKNIPLSLFILMAGGISQIYMMSALRQGMAMSIFFFSYFNYLEKDKYGKYLICVILGLMCHEIALLSIVILFIKILVKKFKLFTDKKFIIVIIVLSIILNIFMPGLINIFTTYYKGYFGQYLGSWSISYSSLALRILLCLAITTIYYFVSDDKKELYKQSVYAYFVLTLVYVSFAGLEVFSRFVDYITVMEIVLIPNMLKDLKTISDKKMKYFLYFVVCGYILVNYVLLYADITFFINWIGTDDMNTQIYYFPESYNELSWLDFYNISFLKYPYISLFRALF